MAENIEIENRPDGFKLGEVMEKPNELGAQGFSTPAPNLTGPSDLNDSASPRFRSRFWTLAGLLLALSLLVWTGLRVRSALADQHTTALHGLALAASSNAQMTAPQELRVSIPVAAKWQAHIALDGTLQPSREAELSFKAQGRVAWLGAKTGDLVEKGAVLARLESDEASLSLRVADANSRAMEAALALSEDTEKRTLALVEGGAQAQAFGVQATKQSALSRAQLDGARAQAALSRAVLSGFTIVAPFRGTVLQAPTAPGFLVGPPGMGSPVFKLADTDTLRIVGTVNDTDASLLHLGDEIVLRKGEKIYHGSLTVILPRVDPQTRRRNVEAALTNDGSFSLAVGALAQGEILVRDSISVLRVPAVALRRGSQDELFVVSDGTLKLRRIRYATDSDGSLLVREGISAGDAVVLDPKADAKDGDRVQAVEGRR